VSDDRDWVFNTLIDLEATDGEVLAAVNRATSNEVASALMHLDLGKQRAHARQRDLNGYRAHLVEQYPALVST
jgi:hypothetical protein